MAVGQVLTAPESGWRRYDDTDNRIVYTGTWISSSSANFYDGVYHYSNVANSSMFFKFYGTKLRFISDTNTDRETISHIVIDGVSEEFTEKGNAAYQIVQYEKYGLSLGVHTVEVKVQSPSVGYIVIDAFDIDADGYFVHPILHQASSLDNMQIGDCIPCRYTTASQNFENLGDVPGLVTADSLENRFNWVFVGYDNLKRMKFVPDRVIQNNISWDTLNNHGLVSEKPVEVYKSTNLIPIMHDFTCGKVKVIHSTTHSTSPEAWRCFGDPVSVWFAYDCVGWIGIDFGEPTTVNAFSLTPFVSTNLGGLPLNFGFEGSNDGTTWDTLSVYRKTDWASGIRAKFSLAKSYTYRMFRITMSQTIGGWSGAVGYFRNIEMLYDSSSPLSDTHNFYLRLPTGGVSSSDTDNEWDKIISESTLGGLITAGDNSVWNWNGVYSWTSSTSSTNTSRVVRGSTAKNGYTQIASSSTSGFRPILLVENLNHLPELLLNINRESTYDAPIILSGTVQDADADDTVKYCVKLNDSVLVDTELTTSPITVNYTIAVDQLKIGSNILSVVATDSNRATSEIVSYTVIRKDTDSFYISDSTCYSGSTLLKAGGVNVAYIKLPNPDVALGYIRTAVLTLNLLNGSGSSKTIKVAPITTDWSSSTVSLAKLPNIDTTNAVELPLTDNTGLVNIAAKKLLDLFMGKSTYGFALYSPSDSIEIDLFNNSLSIVYQPTELIQPDEVHSNAVPLSWKPLVLDKPEAFTKIVLLRSTTTDFSSATTVAEITNPYILNYIDSTAPKGTCYYKLMIYLADNAFQGNQLDFDFEDRSQFVEQDSVHGTNFVGGVAELAGFVEVVVAKDCNSDTGFTYDKAAVEFRSGKVQILAVEG